ncbi:MAG TPA: 50S ribosomal protein L30 [Thermoplasmata archaeon]|nr:50S ribosomal protein L30 [Thermoplasmata archaeon]
MAWMVVRVRGTIHAKHEIAETLRFLHLTRANHATVLPEVPEYKGMLVRAQGYITWGEADPETVGILLHERGTTASGARVGPETLGKEIHAKDLPELTQSVLAGGLPPVAGLRPLFRLKPPKGGWRSTKKPFGLGGALGYRGKAINDLVRRMV